MSSIQNTAQSISLLKTSLDPCPNKNRDTLSKFIDELPFLMKTEEKLDPSKISQRTGSQVNQDKGVSWIAQNVLKQSGSIPLVSCSPEDASKRAQCDNQWFLTSFFSNVPNDWNNIAIEESTLSSGFFSQSIPTIDTKVMDSLNDKSSELLTDRKLISKAVAVSEEQATVFCAESSTKKEKAEGLDKWKGKKSADIRNLLYFEESELNLFFEEEMKHLVSMSLEQQGVDILLDHEDNVVKPIGNESDLWAANWLEDLKPTPSQACKTGISAEFTEFTINVANKQNNTLNSGTKIADFLMRQEKRRLRFKNYQEKIKNNPQQYQSCLEKRRLNHKNYREKIKNNPQQYQSCLEKRRLRQKNYREKIKRDPEKYQALVEKRRIRQQRHHDRIVANPELREAKNAQRNAYRKKCAEKILAIQPQSLKK